MSKRNIKVVKTDIVYSGTCDMDRCAACYLGHEHMTSKHDAYVAKYEAEKAEHLATWGEEIHNRWYGELGNWE